MLASNYNLRVLDNDPDNIGSKKAGIVIEPQENRSDAIRWADLIFATGSTIVNGTITDFLNKEKQVLFYGVTISAAAKIFNLDKYCYSGH